MGISQQLLTMLLWGATVRSEVPAAHTHKGRNNYSPEEPQGKLAVHRCPAKTSGPQEASTGRQGTVLPRGKQTTEEGKQTQGRRYWAQSRMCWQGNMVKFPLTRSAAQKPNSPHM